MNDDNTFYDKLNETTSEWFDKTPDYVHSVGYGYKFVDGKRTDQLSITFYLNKKLTISEVPESELLPKTISVNGVEILTDVIESQMAKYAASCWDYNANMRYGWTDIWQINYLRDKIRPLKGGLSIANFAGSMYQIDKDNNPVGTGQYFDYSVGTMGLIVVDNQDNSLVGLTNAHVVVGRNTWEWNQTQYQTEAKNTFGIFNNSGAHRIYNCIDDVKMPIYGSTRTGSFVQNIYQPGESNDGTINFIYDSEIGKVKRFVSNIPYQNGSNYVDAALISLKQGSLDEWGNGLNVDESNCYNVYCLDYLVDGPMKFATTAEINSVLAGGNELYSVGRSTGPKGLEFGSSLKLIATNVTINIGDGVLNNTYTDALKFQYQDYSPYPVDFGDSGSVLIARFGNQVSTYEYKIIGLVFAVQTQDSPNTSNFAVACRIDRVASALNISAIPTTNNKPEIPKYKDSSAMNVTRFISGVKSNKVSGILCSAHPTNKYWQAGIVYSGDSTVDSLPVNNSSTYNCLNQ
jgi:hypothetical protein